VVTSGILKDEEYLILKGGDMEYGKYIYRRSDICSARPEILQFNIFISLDFRQVQVRWRGKILAGSRMRDANSFFFGVELANTGTL
jgi:hypothetical protein